MEEGAVVLVLLVFYVQNIGRFSYLMDLDLSTETSITRV